MGTLRIILASAVLMVHAGSFFRFNITGGGQVAVQLFYIISGFYMSLVLNEVYDGPGSTRRFFASRLLRLLPVYWVVAVGGVAVHALAYCFTGDRFIQQFDGGLGPGMTAWVVFSNTFLFGLDWLHFTDLVVPGLHPEPLIMPAWTVGLEMTFYVLSPWIVRRRIWVLAALLTASAGARVYAFAAFGAVADPTGGTAWSYRFFPFELAQFMLGAVGYRLYKRIEHGAAAPWFGWSLIPAVLLFQLIQKTVTLGFPGNSVALATLWAIFYLYAAAAIPFLFRETRKNRTDQELGELSYPLYMVHVPLIGLYSLFIDGQMTLISSSLRCLVVLAVSLVLAYALARFVGKPVDLYRHGLRFDGGRVRTNRAA